MPATGFVRVMRTRGCLGVQTTIRRGLARWIVHDVHAIPLAILLRKAMLITHIMQVTHVAHVIGRLIAMTIMSTQHITYIASAIRVMHITLITTSLHSFLPTPMPRLLHTTCFPHGTFPPVPIPPYFPYFNDTGRLQQAKPIKPA